LPFLQTFCSCKPFANVNSCKPHSSFCFPFYIVSVYLPMCPFTHKVHKPSLPYFLPFKTDQMVNPWVWRSSKTAINMLLSPKLFSLLLLSFLFTFFFPSALPWLLLSHERYTTAFNDGRKGKPSFSASCQCCSYIATNHLIPTLLFFFFRLNGKQRMSTL
jgi:hypothetical protein